MPRYYKEKIFTEQERKILAFNAKKAAESAYDEAAYDYYQRYGTFAGFEAQQEHIKHTQYKKFYKNANENRKKI